MKRTLLLGHLGAVAIFLFIIITALCGIRIAGQYPLGIIATCIFFITGLSGVIFWKQLNVWRRLYTSIWVVYAVLLVFALAIERIFFVLLLIPFLFFVLPDNKIAENDAYVIRNAKNLMGSVCYDLYENHTFYEKPLGTSYTNELLPTIKRFRVIPRDAKNCDVVLTLPDNRDSIINFLK